MRSVESQLYLTHVQESYDQQVWGHLIEALREAVAAIGPKEAAYALDVQPSLLAHALAERDRHYVRAHWLPFLIRNAPNDRFVEILADVRGRDLKARKKRSPQQELRALKAAVAANVGPAMQKIIHQTAAHLDIDE